MGKLRVLSGQEVCAILQRHGFVQVRRRSSHVIMQLATDGGTTTVPVPDHNEVKIGPFVRSSASPALPVPSSSRESRTSRSTGVIHLKTYERPSRSFRNAIAMSSGNAEVQRIIFRVAGCSSPNTTACSATRFMPLGSGAGLPSRGRS